MRVQLLALIAAFCILAGCGDSLESELDSLLKARDAWTAHGLGRNYEYTITYHECHCPMRGRTARVTVESGEVVAARYLNSEDVDEVVSVRSVATIRVQLERIFSVLELRERDLPEQEQEVEYDEELGYPRKVFRRNTRVLDSWVEYEISDVSIKS